MKPMGLHNHVWRSATKMKYETEKKVFLTQWALAVFLSFSCFGSECVLSLEKITLNAEIASTLRKSLSDKGLQVSGPNISFGEGGNINGEKVEIKDSSGKVVGYISYKPAKWGSTNLMINDVQIDPSFRGLGASTLLIALALSQQPHVRTITGDLNETNSEDFSRTRNALKTHLGSSAASLGFTKVHEMPEVFAGYRRFQFALPPSHLIRWDSASIKRLVDGLARTSATPH